MEWRQIKGYEGFYEISDSGEIKSVERVVTNNGGEMVVKERILNPWVCSWGYKKVTLHKDGKPHEKFVHRLLAEAFIPPYCGEQVNHIDGDKRNNRLDNLEWCTGTENMRHAYKHGLHPKVVAVKCVETGDVFSSVSEAARAVNGKTSSVWRCINGKRKTHRGYHFVPAEEDDA